IGNLDEATDETEALLRTIVRQHAIADVPVGVFLSGGVDSSTIAGILQSEDSTRVHSFSIGFSDAAYDESADARRVAAHLGTDHEDMIFAPADALAMLSKLPSCYDEPFADASQLPTLLVSKLARSKVKVVLSGDGGDEVFAGYNRHAMAARHELLRRIPHSAGKIVRALRPTDWDRLGRLVPRTLRPQQIGDKLHKLSRCFGTPDIPALHDALLTGWEPGSLLPDYPRPAESVDLAGIADPVLKMQLLDMTGYLPDDILTKIDRASMSVGLEARVPFLDHRLLELAFRLPRPFLRMKASGKIVLRQVLRRYVPTPLFERPKAGFAVPLERWLVGPLREWAENRLSIESLGRDGLVDPVPVRRAWAEQLSGRGNNAMALWGVLMLAEWCEHVHRRDNSWRPRAA
ncbi:MAG: asnB, partial [Rhodospirillales bacterium]|nr:asnB [Rhodospirillales bacterium]